MTEFVKKATSTPEALVENVLHLVSLPEIYLRLQTVLDDPHHTRNDIAEIVGYDPALSARILRIANSAYYSFPNLIQNILTAVSLIGEIELRNIVLASTVISSMRKLNYDGIDINEFWLHSINCGLTARQIGKEVGDCDAENLFLCGMLHDLGLLILYRQESELATAVASHMNENQLNRDRAEREILGFDHAEIGSLLIREWSLSPKLQHLINYHHRPELANDYQRETKILALANQLVNCEFELEASTNQVYVEINQKMQAIGLDQEVLPELSETVDAQSHEICNIILTGVAGN